MDMLQFSMPHGLGTQTQHNKLPWKDIARMCVIHLDFVNNHGMNVSI
jgi:hypothetical protein